MKRLTLIEVMSKHAADFQRVMNDPDCQRLLLRGLKGATEEFLLAATAQNLKRMAKMVPF